MKLIMGQYDAPQKQEQPLLPIDPYNGHIAIFGLPLSGKTTFLKTLLVRLQENKQYKPTEDVYIIDLGGNIGDYQYLQNVCAYCDGSNEENIKQIFYAVERRMADNRRKLGSRSYPEALRDALHIAPTHLFLIIDNVNALFAEEKYSVYQERLFRLCRDGLSNGVTVVITASDLHGIGRLTTSFRQKVAFEMPTDAYYDIFNCRVKKSMRVPGRGIVNIGPETYEFQAFLPFPAEDDTPYLKKMIQEAKENPNPNKLRFLPETLTNSELKSYCDPNLSPQETLIGLDYIEHEPVKLDFNLHRTIAIAGKRNFGKENLLSLILDGTKRCFPNARYVLFDDGRKALQAFTSDGEYALSSDCFYTTEPDALWDYLVQKGYTKEKKGFSRVPPNAAASEEAPTDNPFTVFLLQGKKLFNRNYNLCEKVLPELCADALAKGYLLIFPDLPCISDGVIRDSIYNNLSALLLLEDICDYMTRQHAYFTANSLGVVDTRELRAEYAPCVMGDGFFYDTEADELKKIKLIQLEGAKNE